jgi:ATP phosphoribosyltransferase regulatory subunit
VTSSIVEAARKAALQFADRLWDFPALQPAGLYLELAGEALRAKAFLVAGEEDQLCLRHDMTVPAIRAALTGDAWSKPFGVAYDGAVFRRDQDPDRFEMRQIGVERFAPKAEIDAAEGAMLAAAVEVCDGVEDLRIRVGDLRVAAAIAEASAFPPAWAERLKLAFTREGGAAWVLEEAAAPAPEPSPLAEALAGMSDAHAADAVRALLEDGGFSVLAGRAPADISARLRRQALEAASPRPSAEAIEFVRLSLAVAAPPAAAFKELSKLAKSHKGAAQPEALRAAADRASGEWGAPAEALGDRVVFSPGFGRGLSYYDGFLFEIEAQGDVLAGGGRYDGLLHHVASAEGGLAAARSWSAAGFALRPDRIAEARR